MILRTVPKEQAKQWIRDLFQREDVLYFSDISQRLGLELELVVECCAELQRAGEIKVAQDLPEGWSEIQVDRIDPNNCATCGKVIQPDTVFLCLHCDHTFCREHFFQDLDHHRKVGLGG